LLDSCSLPEWTPTKLPLFTAARLRQLSAFDLGMNRYGSVSQKHCTLEFDNQKAVAVDSFKRAFFLWTFPVGKEWGRC
jgi:hypothetical protein